MISFRKILVVVRVIASLLIITTPTANGFAAWLKCYIDLADHEEIIMNSPIILYDSLSNELHKQVQIEIKTQTSTEWITASSEGSAVVTFPPDSKSTIQARLRVPEGLARQSMQYVIELVKNGCPDNNVETCGTKFIRPVMCKGKRSHANDYTTAVVFEIDGTSSSGPIELVAGWASGHEAVKMTQSLILKPATSSDGAQQEL